MKKVKQPYFTSVSHDYNSAEKLEVGGTLICHRFLVKKKKAEKRERLYAISFKRSFFKTLKEGKKTSCCTNYDVQK